MMFSGIIEVRHNTLCYELYGQKTSSSTYLQDIGTVDCLKTDKNMVLWDGSTGEGVELTVRSKLALEDAYIGCSIAVNGVCLTVISYDDEKVTCPIIYLIVGS